MLHTIQLVLQTAACMTRHHILEDIYYVICFVFKTLFSRVVTETVNQNQAVLKSKLSSSINNPFYSKYCTSVP